jgi:uncharacterized protein (TIGR02231 family)
MNLWNLIEACIKRVINLKKMNKSTALLLALLGIASVAKAIKPIKAKIDQATVYLQGAHLYYQENLQLIQGNNEILFENISPSIHAQTLQASCKGGTVMDVQYQIKYKEMPALEQKYAKAILRVLDSIEGVGYAIQELDNQIYVIELEKKMLLNFKLIKGDSPKDSLPLLGQAMDFTHDRLNRLLHQNLQFEIKRNNETKTLKFLEERLQNLRLLQSGEIQEVNAAAQPSYQVIVTLYAETAGAAQVNFNYFTPNASWVPVYELQANSDNNKMQVKYFAQVQQSSSLNWKDVFLTLSSSNPLERNIKPNLSTWYISFVQYRQLQQKKHLSKNISALKIASNAYAPSQTEDVKAMEDLSEAKEMSEYVNISENLIRTSYEIKLKYNIETGGKSHRVMVKQDDIAMSLQFAAVPKLSADAYLLAKVSGWEDLNLLPGAARVFFDNGYIGESFINPQSESDTLDFNLGNDKSLVVQRRKIKEKSKTKILENDKVEIRTYEILVRNTKNQSVWMNLEDQIPVVTGTQEIKVNLLESDGAVLDEVTGLLTWKLKIASKETKKVRFTYEVRYPKDKLISGL